MSYYTAYSLEILNADNFPEKSYLEIEREVAIELARLDYFRDTVERQSEWEAKIANSEWPIDEILGYDTMKWYDCEADMHKIAKKFPQYKFRLHGQGEDSDDFWEEYFFNENFKFCKGHRTYDPAPEWAFED